MVSLLLVAVPLAVRYAGTYLPWFNGLLSMIDSWSLVGVFVMLATGLIVSHLWLPDGRRKIMDVLPGIILTLIAWSVGAYVFASYITTFATYVSTYAGLASIMIALVFLYIVGVIFILGAEINAAIMKYKVKRMVIRHIMGRRQEEVKVETAPEEAEPPRQNVL
jgi:membrane protein